MIPTIRKTALIGARARLRYALVRLASIPGTLINVLTLGHYAWPLENLVLTSERLQAWANADPRFDPDPKRVIHPSWKEPGGKFRLDGKTYVLMPCPGAPLVADLDTGEACTIKRLAGVDVSRPLESQTTRVNVFWSTPAGNLPECDTSTNDTSNIQPR